LWTESEKVFEKPKEEVWDLRRGGAGYAKMCILLQKIVRVKVLLFE